MRRARDFLFKIWRDWRWTFFFIVFVLVPVKSSVADWNWVPSGSMNPTILEGDLVFVNKAAYGLRFPLTLYRVARWGEPGRGDIVVCFSPEDGTRLVKRVIGVPGDTIEMRGNVLFVNGRRAVYSEAGREYRQYLSERLKDSAVLAREEVDGVGHAVMSTPSVRAVRSFGPIRVPAGKYFVMGDNRDNSRDSRFFGFVERKSIVGKAEGVVWSFDITERFEPRFGRFFSGLK